MSWAKMILWCFMAANIGIGLSEAGNEGSLRKFIPSLIGSIICGTLVYFA
jgi:hypothetical protein